MLAHIRTLFAFQFTIYYQQQHKQEPGDKNYLGDVKPATRISAFSNSVTILENREPRAGHCWMTIGPRIKLTRDHSRNPFGLFSRSGNVWVREVNPLWRRCNMNDMQINLYANLDMDLSLFFVIKYWNSLINILNSLLRYVNRTSSLPSTRLRSLQLSHQFMRPQRAPT